MIFEFIYGAMQLAAAGAGGLWLVRDYRRNFQGSKTIILKIQRALGMAKEGDDISRANTAVERYAKNLGSLREAVATIKSNHLMAERQAHEQRRLAAEFESVEIEALRKGDEDAAAASAMAKIQSLKRAELFETHAAAQISAARLLQNELDAVEMEFEVVRTEADTIRIYAGIGEANRQLYQLISHVEAETGLTARGELKQTLLDTERKMLKSGILIEMVQNQGNGKVKKLLQIAEVRQDLDEVRKQVALPAAPVAISANGNERST